MARPLVSVILPSYNRLEWLPTAVLSVRSQNVPDWGLLLIDDGSSARWARSLAEPRFRYFHQNHTGSIAAARNAGVSEARGDRRAAYALPDRRLRQIARRQLRARRGTFVRQALRHGAVGDMVRVAGVFTRW